MKFEKKSMVQLFTIIFISEMIISRVDFNPLTERVLSGVIIDIIYASVEFGLHGLFDPLESIFNNIFFSSFSASFMSPHTPTPYYPNAATPGTYEDQ